MAEMAPDLMQRVQDLPPELFNQIYAHVFAVRCNNDTRQFPNTAKSVFITEAYKHPSILQVSRAHRETVAEHYFANGMFVFTSVRVFRKFFTTLDTAFMKLTPNFKVIVFDQTAEMDQDALAECIDKARGLKLRYTYFIPVSCLVAEETLEGWVHQDGVRLVHFYEENETGAVDFGRRVPRRVN